MKQSLKTSLILALLLFCPRPAAAYVDPGVVGSLYQIIYVVVFGALLGFVARPYKYLTSLFDRLKKKLKGRSR